MAGELNLFEWYCWIFAAIVTTGVFVTGLVIGFEEPDGIPGINRYHQALFSSGPWTSVWLTILGLFSCGVSCCCVLRWHR